MLKISAAKVAHVIAHAREHDIVAGSWEHRMQAAFHEDDGGELLDEFEIAAAKGELAAFIQTLSHDEKASLLAIAWIGRGTYPPDRLDEAFEKARCEQPLAGLTSIPLLADYLYDGLQKLGLPVPSKDDRLNRQ
jgi:hypothetical protein